jgi:hypothetical protein
MWLETAEPARLAVPAIFCSLTSPKNWPRS